MKGEVIEFPAQHDRDLQDVLAAMMEYEAAYEAYAKAVKRYLTVTDQMHLMRHFLPFEEEE